MDNNAPQPAPLPPTPMPPKQPFHLTTLNKISIIVVVVLLIGLVGYVIASRTGQSSQLTPQPTQPVTEQQPSLSPVSSGTTGLTPTMTQSLIPADPTGLAVTCNSASPSATLTWNAVAGSDLYFVHVRGGIGEDTRVYGTSHVIQVQTGQTYNWWMEAVKHNSDFSQSYASKSIGGPSIKCS